VSRKRGAYVSAEAMSEARKRQARRTSENTGVSQEELQAAEEIGQESDDEVIFSVSRGWAREFPSEQVWVLSKH